MPADKKIAVVYDWLDKWGGVERLLLTFNKIFPNAVFYTSVYNKNSASWAKDLKIKTSYMQKLPGFIKNNRIVSVPFYPFAFESFDFSEYDVVISVTSSFAKSILTKPPTKHICYLLTPTRFLWSHADNYLNNKWSKIFFDGYIEMLKEWDVISARRPDEVISISQNVRNRCKKYYQLDSRVLYPPFDLSYWQGFQNRRIQSKNKLSRTEPFFLVVSRLEPYKKIDLAIKTFNKLKLRLLIVGEGSEEKKLKKLAGENISFLSRITDGDLAELYEKAEALIMPQEEDFGYVSLEAQVFGCPVISFIKGGAAETVLDGKTGIFFDGQTEKKLRGAVERFMRIKYNLRTETSKTALDHLKKFDKEVFINKFKALI